MSVVLRSLFSTPSIPLCAASLLRYYLSDSGKRDSDFLFTKSLFGRDSPVPYFAALSCLKTWSKKAGLQKDIGFHSLRRGSATFMYTMDIPLIPIQKAGDWQSLCVLDYLSIDFDHKKKVESLVSSSL